MKITSVKGILSTTEFYILLAVADKTLHGYGIRDQIIQDSQGELILSTGTLYPAIKRLATSSLLESFDDIDPMGNPITRYRITARGRRQLEADAKRLHHVYYHARLKLGHKIFGPGATV